MRGPEAQRLGGPERGRLVDRLISWPEGRREVNERAKVQIGAELLCKGAKVKSTREPHLVTSYRGTEKLRRGEITPFNADLSPD